MFCKSDFHIHSSLSPCARGTMLLPDILERCRRLGVEAIGISDHFPFDGQVDKLAAMLKNIHLLKGTLPQVCLGTEVNFSVQENRHSLTLQQKQDFGFQYIIGSHHQSYIETYDENKLIEQQHRHYLLTCQNPVIDILGHPYRMQPEEFQANGWPWFSAMNRVPRSFIRELGQAARDTGTAIEINAVSNLTMPANPPSYVGQYMEFLSILADEGASFSLGSDAHDLSQLDTIPLAWQAAEQLNLTADRIWQPRTSITMPMG